MLRTALYVDAENIKLSGGFGMRYDVLVGLANSGNSIMLRANCYLAEDRERIKNDIEYRQKIYNYHNILRQCGFRIVKKYVRRYVDEEGNTTTKANSDMDLAIDALLQSRKLDRIILLSGDSDFIRLIPALQDQGCRVEVIGFNNVSKELREAADSFISGFLIPGLLPAGEGSRDEDGWLRGVVSNYNVDRGFGFFRYYRLNEKGLQPESVFFHLSQSTLNSEHFFQDPYRIFEFRVVENPANGNRTEAQEIRLLAGS